MKPSPPSRISRCLVHRGSPDGPAPEVLLSERRPGRGVSPNPDVSTQVAGNYAGGVMIELKVMTPSMTSLTEIEAESLSPVSVKLHVLERPRKFSVFHMASMIAARSFSPTWSIAWSTTTAASNAYEEYASGSRFTDSRIMSAQTAPAPS